MSKRPLDLQGWVGEGFEPVAAEFQRQLDESPDAGAAFAAVVDGHLVVDLWGGTADADSSTPWGSPLPVWRSSGGSMRR